MGLSELSDEDFLVIIEYAANHYTPESVKVAFEATTILFLSSKAIPKNYLVNRLFL